MFWVICLGTFVGGITLGVAANSVPVIRENRVTAFLAWVGVSVLWFSTRPLGEDRLAWLFFLGSGTVGLVAASLLAAPRGR